MPHSKQKRGEEICRNGIPAILLAMTISMDFVIAIVDASKPAQPWLLLAWINQEFQLVARSVTDQARLTQNRR